MPQIVLFILKNGDALVCRHRVCDASKKYAKIFVSRDGIFSSIDVVDFGVVLILNELNKIKIKLSNII